MRSKLVRMGNSRGVRLPKPILEASGLTDDIEIEVEKGRIVLLPAKKKPREGWAEDARRMAANGDDVDPWEGATGLNSWDDEAWTWPEDFEWPEGEIVSTYISPSSIPSEAPKSLKPDRASSSRRTRSTKPSGR
jgi:antitoxin MazE